MRGRGHGAGLACAAERGGQRLGCACQVEEGKGVKWDGASHVPVLLFSDHSPQTAVLQAPFH